MNARTGFYAQGNRFALSAELETGRMARSHAQRIGSMKASIGGSGAVADSGTTWDVIIAQDTENQAEMNAFRIRWNHVHKTSLIKDKHNICPT